MRSHAYFDDAYTQPGYLAALPGQPAARFTYRPALIEERSRLGVERRRLEPSEFARRLMEFVTPRIVSCNLLAGSGLALAGGIEARGEVPREVFFKACRERRPDALAKLSAIVLGYASSDIDPDWPAAMRETLLALAAGAARDNRSLGEARQERDEREVAAGVSLLLAHPRLVQRTCERCRRWMYGDDHRVRRWNGRPLRRPPTSPTPCWKCPKHGPDQAAPLERMAPRVERLLDFYFQVRATWGRALDADWAHDAHLLRDLAIVGRLVARREHPPAASPASRNRDRP